MITLSMTALVAACEVGPNYVRPTVETPPAFMEAQGWTPAQPADTLDRGDWWSVFNDPLLNQLESQVEVSNQNLAAAAAAYDEARAVVSEDRAALFPTIDLDASATRSKSGGGSIVTSGAGSSTVTRGAVSEYQLGLDGTWQPDVWGRVRRTIEGAKALAQASAADLANAKLSAQSELAANYLELRLIDAQKAVLKATVDAYGRSLTVTRNQYLAGTVNRSDVLQAQTTLDNAQASLVDLDTQRTASEHAVAVLTGKPPAELTIAADPNWAPKPPETPGELPSALLQRRPDISAAERTAANANAQIGVQVAGFFPNITLSGSVGVGGSQLSSLFSSSSTMWSLGASAVQTVFDAGATRARVREAKAARAEAIAQYRETVLTAFQQVEDDLAAARVLQNEEPLRLAASQSADQAETVAMNEYKAGTVDYTTVATAQAAALSARQTLLTIQVQRMTNAVSLIEALGGGWSTTQLPK